MRKVSMSILWFFPSGQDPVNPGLSSFWKRVMNSNLNIIWLSTQLAMSFVIQSDTDRLCFNRKLQEVVCLSEMRVLLGTIIDGLHVLTLVRRNWE